MRPIVFELFYISNRVGIMSDFESFLSGITVNSLELVKYALTMYAQKDRFLPRHQNYAIRG